jgi:hypothetical protein
MKKTITLLSLLMPIMIWTSAGAEEFEDSIRVIGQTQLPQFPGVTMYTLDFWQDGSPVYRWFWGIDSNYVKQYAQWDFGPDTTFFSQPPHLVKATGLEIGNSWYTTYWGEITALSVAVSETTWTVGSTPLPAMKVNITPVGWSYVAESNWFSTGVGLLGFHQFNQSGVGDLSLLAYSVQGGYGNFPLAVGNWWRFQETWETSNFYAPTAYINPDGNMSDWAGITPMILDQQYDDISIYDGCDIKDVYMALNPSRTMLYMMADFWDGYPNTYWGQQQYSAYHFTINYVNPDSIAEVDVNYYEAGQWGVYGYNVNMANAAVGVGNVVEVALPLANLGNPPEIYGYQFSVTSGGFSPTDQTDRVNVLLTANAVENPIPAQIPRDIALLPSCPNPFNSQTAIRYDLPTSAVVQLEIFDISGCRVATLVNARQSAGTHQIMFDGSNLASGIYLCRIQAGEFQSVQKLVLLK